MIKKLSSVQILNIKRWTTALRSGRWRKIKGNLKKGHGNCCAWGVACDVFSQELGFEDFGGGDGFRNKGQNNRMNGAPPPLIVHAVGGEIIEGEIMAQNDHMGASFSQIADFIEEKLLGEE